MATVEATAFHGVYDDMKIKVEYETHEDLDLNPHSHADWKLNPNVECRVILQRLPSAIIKKEFQWSPEGQNSQDAAHVPEHVNHCLIIQRNIKEEPEDVEEDDKDPLGDLEPRTKWKYFSTFTNLEAKTAETHKEEKLFKCESCEKIFICSFDLFKHKTCHQSESVLKQHKCETCGKCFDWPSLLNNHMACHVTIKSFTCGECGKRFSCLRYLQAHQVCHTEIKRFKCNVCEESFARLDVLKNHFACHHKIKLNKSFKCGECEKEFASNSALNQHMDCHTEPHKCNLCVKSFSSSYYLKRHMKYHHHHTTGKSYKCDVCEKEVSCLSALKTHQRCHQTSRKGQYKCNICKERLVTPLDFKAHMDSIHPVENPFKCDVARLWKDIGSCMVTSEFNSEIC